MFDIYHRRLRKLKTVNSPDIKFEITEIIAHIQQNWDYLLFGSLPNHLDIIVEHILKKFEDRFYLIEGIYAIYLTFRKLDTDQLQHDT